MKSLSRSIAVTLLCLTAACGGSVEDPGQELGTTEQHSRPCTHESQCPSTQTCVVGTCVPTCDLAAPTVVCGSVQCCPGYLAPNGNQSKPYCNFACYDGP
ncbi:hypothetical protein HUA74_11760 [Myxococcus sp. CA051A]|uniref:Lipoprotein n=1 Tax=Myxococcus llanfairpwllgwyngyllgogerychwyrndrobwllllantysiliogogogochensis TaxID=2590453 RepID=A0A540WXX8_9BACT|nr:MULTISPECIES: hypothetical protein [Myxococcus]NTX05197.1 hypothetical protein [Myxococcus sp. CA040A]NTX09238.1 hypothetical protein [Myxococcus sp. CA056]NTX39759.1 hypothetical protein [Myxococcus sp. CA033]NTX57587.1 hypothetical protein [Myxococcus sp. CA039A]NTX61343.1 hypothetical protein [Myxococcus sp. CA051A]